MENVDGHPNLLQKRREVNKMISKKAVVWNLEDKLKRKATQEEIEAELKNVNVRFKIQKKYGDSRRYNYAYIKNFFERNDCKLISKEYKNSKQLLSYVCSCGNVAKISFNKFQIGHRCMKCKGTPRFTYEYVKSEFKKRGCVLLSKEYKGNSFHLDYICDCGNKSKITFQHFKEGNRCSKCGAVRKRQTRRNNLPYIYDNITFLSKEEIDCYKFLKKLKIQFQYGFQIDTKEIDFFINKRLFWEHHPHIKNFHKETTEEYYLKRRRLLDENGYRDYPLIVTTSLNEIDKVKDIIQKEKSYDNILKYYKSKDFNPQLPDNPKFRLFKGKDRNRRWHVNKKTIRNEKQLKNWIIKSGVIDIFYTKNLFKNPRKLLNYDSITNQIILQDNICIDIDEDFSIDGLEKARKDALVVIDELRKEFGLEPKEICFTGSKGFRIIYELYNVNRDNIDHSIMKRKIYKLRKQYNISIDGLVLGQEKQIIRQNKSINSKSNLLCREISQGELNKPIQEILKLVNVFNVQAPLKPPALETGKKVDDKGGLHLHPPLPLSNVERDGVISHCFTNRSGKRYVLFIKHKIQRKKLLKKIQQKYDTGTLYGFKQDDFYYWVSPRTFQKERLKKVLKAAQSLNIKEFYKFGNNMFTLKPKPIYAGKIVMDTKAYLSKEHLMILEAIADVEKYQNIHKNKKLEIVTGIKYGKP